MDIDPTRAVYVISVAAELAGVHPQTLRIYERKGLVNPARTGGGSRRYSEHDIEALRRVVDLTNEGLTLVGVKKVLALEKELAATRKKLAEAAQKVEQAVSDGQRAVAEARRENRRDLVPVSKSVTVYRRKR